MLFANALQQTHKKKKRKIKSATTKRRNFHSCRICNKEKGKVPIFDNILYPNIPDDIRNFSGVTISESQHLSTKMCQNCLDLLNGCIMFRELCQRSSINMIEVAVKTENSIYIGDRKVEGDSEDSFYIPSPVFSEEYTDIWSCFTCSKEYDNLESYNSHLLTCSTQTSEEKAKIPEEVVKKKFLCDICGKTAFSNASLLIHMSTHENVFPFKCDVCPYQGRTMDLLKVHKRTHLADKPFKCTQCPKATTTSSNLVKHMRHVHSTTRPFKCTYCEKAFSFQHDMKRHIRDIHLRQGTVECEVCYKKFNTKKILQGHRAKIHKIKGERLGRIPSYLQCQVDEPKENVMNDYNPL